MWWIYLAGSGLCFLICLIDGIMNYFNPTASDGTFTLLGFVAGIWLLNSARVAYKEDQKTKTS